MTNKETNSTVQSTDDEYTTITYQNDSFMKVNDESIGEVTDVSFDDSFNGFLDSPNTYRSYYDVNDFSIGYDDDYDLEFGSFQLKRNVVNQILEKFDTDEKHAREIVDFFYDEIDEDWGLAEYCEFAIENSLNIPKLEIAKTLFQSELDSATKDGMQALLMDGCLSFRCENGVHLDREETEKLKDVFVEEDKSLQHLYGSVDLEDVYPESATHQYSISSNHGSQ
jgi:hypothetical protein